MFARTINTSDELKELKRGSVVVSSHWLDAYSFIGGSESPWGLLNVATGYRTSLAELGDFFPATVVYEYEFAGAEK